MAITVNIPNPITTTTAIVNITSAQILAMGSTPIELLPAPGVGKYYDIERIFIEYSLNTTPYTWGTSSFLRLRPYDKRIYTFSSDGEIAIFKDYLTAEADGVLGITIQQNEYLNHNVTLRTDDASDPTLGDGTLRAIITYTVRTFGA